jgi:hypothetical protein
VVCDAVLSKMPFGGALMGAGGTPARPTLGVRLMRGGIRLAYGAAGAFTGTGAGLLQVPHYLLRGRSLALCDS